MSAEIVTMLGGFATLFAAGGTFAMFMFRLFVRLEGRVDALAADVAGLRGEVADLRGDLTALAREVADLRGDLTALARKVSELRGEFRGRSGTHPAAQ